MLAFLTMLATLAAPAVGEHDGVFHVTARLSVEAPSAVVFSVLTDYDRMPRFIASVKRSKLERRDGRRAIVTQDLAARLWWFHRDVRVLLAIDEAAPARIDFVDQAHGDFELYRGSWQLAAAGARTEVTYTLDAKPRGSTAGARRVLASTSMALLGQIRDECLRRSRP